MSSGVTTYTHNHETEASYTSYSYYAGIDGNVSFNDSSYVHYSASRIHIGSPAMVEPDYSQDSASSILQSVKEQEAQFDRLTRELEAERRSVADQLEHCNIGSQVGSIRSLNSAGLENGSFAGYIQQGPTSLSNGGDNDSTHLVESCLKVLQERGIMQSDVEPRGKTVAFGQNETHQYNGYDSRGTSSTQNSYRQPEGGGMSRSQANYALSDAAGDYISYPEHGEGSYRQDESSYRQDEESSYRQDDEGSYRQDEEGLYGEQQGDSYRVGSHRYDSYRDHTHPYVNIDSANFRPLRSEGDYVESITAQSYLNNHGDYEDHEDVQRSAYPPNSHSDSRTPEPHINGDHTESGEFGPPSPATFERYNRQEYNSSDRVSQASHDPVRDSQALRASQDLLHTHNIGSRGDLRNSQEQLSRSRDRLNRDEYLRGSQDQLHNAQNSGYLPQAHPTTDGEMAHPSHTHPSNDSRYDSYTGRSYQRSEQAELYGEDRPTNTGTYYGRQPSYNERLESTSSHPMLADPALLYGSRHSLDSRPEADQRFRPPELPEVIDYLSHPNNAVKANAAAYLQHLCYGNNEVKARAGNLKGIPALVQLLYNDVPEVHRNALGALLNLSRGYENDDNKRAIKNCSGIEALAALLERSRDNDVRELVTGILWNMSSLGELKKPVITSALKTLVKSVIVPASGASNSREVNDISWSTEFRNATGVLRNVSSDGLFARKQLRECDGLLESLLNVTHSVIGRAEMDNKPVENIVCTLRNLSFRLMEVDYPGYYERKLSDLRQPKKSPSQDLSILGCFGKSPEQTTTTIEYPCRTEVGRRRGEQLWQTELVDMYLPLLSDCSNTDTLEAAVGAIQNLTACEWQPSIAFREHIRKKRGLPTIVELLGLEEADNVVCGAAIALRNLAIDKSNKTLIGKYAIQQLVSKLPPTRGASLEHNSASEETIRAVLAALHEVLKDRDLDSVQHASTLVNDSDGVRQLMSIAKSQKKYTAKTLRCTHHLLTALWRFSSLRDAYKSKGYKESDFLSKSMVPKASMNTGTMSVASTLTRPRSEPPSNSNTIARTNGAFRDDRHDERSAGYTYLTNGTLPIQRPLYQQQEGSLQRTHGYNSQPSYNTNASDLYGAYGTITPSNGSYRQGHPQESPRTPNHPDTTDYPNLVQTSLNLSQSREGLIPNGQDRYGGTQASQANAEPLYARVDKRKPLNNANQSFQNPSFNDATAVSMESLNHRTDFYSLRPSSRQENTGVDSWV